MFLYVWDAKFIRGNTTAFEYGTFLQPAWEQPPALAVAVTVTDGDFCLQSASSLCQELFYCFVLAFLIPSTPDILGWVSPC